MIYRIFLLAIASTLLIFACSSNSHNTDDPDSGDTDSDTDNDSDTDTDSDADEWCPELSTSCGNPDELSNCGDAGLDAPRLIYPLSGKYVRDRRPQIIWDGASGVSQYRIEIALDRDFTEVVYRSADYEDYPGFAGRYSHIVDCDLSCGVHFFRVVSVTSPECEISSPSYVWEMFVGMAPYDLDRDGTPDIMCWHIEPAQGEFSNNRVQGFGIFNLDEMGGQEIEEADLELLVDFEMESNLHILYAMGLGDFNGDNHFDVGVNITTKDGSDYDGYFVGFSELDGQFVQARDDAVLDIFAGTPGYDQVQGSVLQKPFIFNDLNGDGLSDLYIIESVTNSVTHPSIHYLLLGRTSEFIGESTNILEEFVSGGSYGMADINGDGISDFLLPVLDGFGVSYGNRNLSGEIDLLSQHTEIEGFASALTWGDWIFGTEPYFSYLLGDIDFDGYLEVGATISATDTTTYCSETMGPLSTGAAFVLSDISGNFSSTLDTMIETFFIADLPVAPTVNSTENFGWILPAGNIGGDFLPDLVLLTDVYDSSHSNYPGRYFSFHGGVQWNSYNLFSQASSVAPSFGEDNAFIYYIADIDGDGFSDTSGSKSTYSGEILVLSSSGQEIKIPSHIREFCGNSAGLLLPELLN